MYITKKVSELTPLEYRACKLANYGEWEGFMYSVLAGCRKDPEKHPGIVIMDWEGPDNTVRSLRAWALLTPVDTTHPLLYGTTYTKRKAKYSVEFWVKRQHRRKGVGKALMLEVKKIDARPHVFPHDGPSGEFFSNFDVTVTRYDKYHLKNKPKVA